MALRIMEPSNNYNVEDLDTDVEVYKELERTIWQRADLALKWREQLADFAAKSGENINTLKQYARVARTYEKNNRLFSCSFKHYMVAMSNPARMEWLRKAEENNWTVNEMMKQMNPPKGKPLPKPEPLTDIKGITSLRIDPYVPIDLEVLPAPVLPNDAFKPFVIVFNQLYLDGAIAGLNWEQILLLVFGQDDGIQLVFEENFGYRIVNTKIGPLEDGPSQ